MLIYIAVPCCAIAFLLVLMYRIAHGTLEESRFVIIKVGPSPISHSIIYHHDNCPQ